LQANYVEDQQLREKLAEAQNRVKSIALIHEKLYQTRDLDHLDFAEYLRGLTDHLVHSFLRDPGQVVLNLQVGPEEVNLDTAVPLGIIINELVSNSLKYAFPHLQEKTDDRPNEITIELAALEEDQLLLTVGDNGVGLPEEIDPDSAPSLGLQLVRMLTSHMGGTLELDRRNGTVYRIKLHPVKMDKSFTP
jgi:two-component sensor histidine kinase